jgi:hypothetical protein
MFYRLGPKTLEEQEPEARARATAALMNPDRLRCPRCSTTLEDFRDNFAESAPEFLRMIASVVAFIPGFGTVAAYVLGTVASLAAGESIENSLVDNVMGALPGGFAWSAAKDFAGGVLKGERLDRAVSDGVRAAIREEGGDLAAAAYDGVMAVAQGKSAQDAGFAVLNAYARGNSLAEKMLTFGESAAHALETGQGLPEVLITELATDVYAAAGDRVAEMIDAASKRLLSPELRQLGTDALATALGVSEPIARAAQVITESGVLDLVKRAAILDAAEKARRVQFFSETVVAAVPSRLSQQASSALAAASARAALFHSTAVAVPGAFDVLSRASLAVPVSQRLTVTAPVLVPSAAAQLVHVAPPVAVASSTTRAGTVPTGGGGGLVSDLALGGVVAAAGVALFWWARAK